MIISRNGRKNAIILGGVALGVLVCSYIVSSANIFGAHPGYSYLQAWSMLGGHWIEHDGIFSNQNSGRGDMLLVKHWRAGDYRIAADIRFDQLFADTHYGDAGLVIRTSDPQPGVDSYTGYYAGIRPDDSTIVLGRAAYGWRQLTSLKLTTPVAVGIWYHMEFIAKECNLTVTVNREGQSGEDRIEYRDDQCLPAGGAGLRSYYVRASWRNIQLISQR